MTREPNEERISHRHKTKAMKNIKRKVVKINLSIYKRKRLVHVIQVAKYTPH